MKAQIYRKLRKEFLKILKTCRGQYPHPLILMTQLREVLYELRLAYYTFEGKKFHNANQVMKEYAPDLNIRDA